MSALTQRELRLLALVNGAPAGSMDQEDYRLDEFTDDTPGTDTFNRCTALGLLKAWNDDRTGCGTVEITKAGRERLASNH